MDTLFVLIFCACASGVQGNIFRNYHYVIAPNVIRLDSQEKFLVGILGSNRTLQLDIWFEYLEQQLLRQSVWIYSPETPVLVTFKVTANDLFANVEDVKKTRNKPKTIRLVCQDNLNNKQIQDIPLSFKSGYLIVQTDKPLYNPTQTVNVRVLAMDENMKPVKNKYLEIDLINPSNMAVGRKPFPPGSSINGFYRCDFELPPFPEIGTWTIKAKFGDMLETYAIAPIDVREFVLPTFGIHLETTPAYILPTDDTVSVAITAMYVYGKAVDGTARLLFDIRREGEVSNNKTIFTMENVLQLSSTGTAQFTIDIKSLKANKGGSFPAGGVLELSATVHESATGKEESEFDDSVKFVRAPYIFDLSRSKTTFRKGSIYYLQVLALNVLGIKAANITFNVEVYNANRIIHSLTRRTDSSGQSLEDLQSGVFANPGTYTLKVFTPGFSNYGEQIQLQPFTADETNNIVVEKVDLEGHPQMRATTNIQKHNEYTGILFVVFARGKIVYHAHRTAAMHLSVPLGEDIIAKLAPVGRIVAFYVDKRSDTVVADSLSFYIESDQRKNKLKIEPAKQQVLPGASSPLSVFGPSGMWVGFNVIDKALLLLNSDKTLTHDKLLKEIGNHDLGCGAGSGTTTEEILKNAGVTLLISTGTLNKDRLQRHSEGCMGTKRRRRSLTECLYGADLLCCSEGIEYANEVKTNYTDALKTRESDYEVEEPVPNIVCYARVRQLAKWYGELPHKCLMAYYRSCLDTLTDALSETLLASGRSVFDSQTQYQMDIDRLPGRMLTVRRQFDTSFFFEEHMISGSNFTHNLKFRDSITEWTIQAIGISEDDGPHIAESKDVKTFKDFFVQVDLPYKATRKELFNVKVTVFNYVQTELTARVYLKGVDKLCYGTTPGQNSPPQTLTLPPNSAKSMLFGVIALEEGKRPITVSALVVDDHQPYVDIVEKQLYVVNEGIQERKTITVCLDPANKSKSCINSPEVTRNQPSFSGIRPSVTMTVDLTLPVSALRGSGLANAYLSTNMMSKPVDTVIHGVGGMLNMPGGCCQQTFWSTVPVVTGLYYLKQTGTITEQQKQSGHMFLSNGIQLLTVKGCINSDGSLNTHHFYRPALWITAFVVRVMCQAEQAVPGSFGRSRIEQMLGYLSTRTRDGYDNFIDLNPIYSSKDFGPSLTAYVLATMQECQDRTQSIQNSIQTSISALERLSDSTLIANPYLLAISTYALALSNSTSKERFFTRLRDMKRDDGDRMYWSKSIGLSDADTIETTAYALLAHLQFDDMHSSQKIAAWLTQNVRGSGSWLTTKDSAVAFQAVAAFSARNYIPEVDLETRIESGDGQWVKTNHLSNQNTVLNTLIPGLKVPNGDTLKVRVTGVGTGILKIDLFYSRLAEEDEICPFEISPIKIKDVITEIADNQEIRLIDPQRPCDVCGYCPESESVNVNISLLQRRQKRQVQEERPILKCVEFSVRTKSPSYEAGMSIVEVNLETGVRVVESDLKILQSNYTVFPLYEMPTDGKGFIIFYLSKITSRPINFIFRLKDDFSGNETTRQGASVRVYDYYNPEKTCMKQYSINPNKANTVAMACERGEQCKCVQSQCSQPVDDELFRMASAFAKANAAQKRTLPKPVDKLMEYACNFEKANYVVHVTIITVANDTQRNVRFASSTVKDVLLQGGGNIQVGDEIDFEWQTDCEHPAFEVGQPYYVIGKDISRLIDGDVKSVRYDLMGTTLVINPRYKDLLGRAMNNFAAELKKNNGCTN
ncbi:complement C3-like [Dreissena polymorpha]|uniref:NTR domain-containing protein n=1 Tax=Dreissena polymorpha TaxID=45954 RepID=A0A9D4E2J1_DREPO|nr:complement C3-like [Dreissena polymorpha]XP_052231744.1 complement C3-like [Dreissena polymorpha]KAH3770835.1 hypothetical protein DPMN_172131 [Dreissena polymorpha]